MPDQNADAAIAVTRFGLGARRGEIELASSDPRGFLRSQIRPEGAEQPQAYSPIQLKPTPERLIEFVSLRQEKLQDPDQRKALLQQRRQPLEDEFLARAGLACKTDAGFRERWALFWFNHFTVSQTKGTVVPIIGSFEREAIRPHVFGRFADLLIASSRHPAMLLYLDQAESVGPNSPAATGTPRRPPGSLIRVAARKKSGLNENLAREIMELHSLGVDSGYTQSDVTEFARALTGWSIGRPRDGAGYLGTAVFRMNAHEPGARRILGRDYAQEGAMQASSALLDFAASSHTAHHLAVKIARHFVADDPPASLVARLETSYMSSGGRLDRVADALISAPESWDPAPNKFKTPYEFLVSSWRASGIGPTEFGQIAGPLNQLGQRPFGAPSPKGWEDDEADWATPDAIVKRMTWASGFGQRVAGQADPVEIAQQALGPRLSPAVATAIARAESRPEAFAILLMSPEFQRR